MARYPDMHDFGEVVLRRYDPTAMAEEVARVVNENFDRLHQWMPWAAERPTVESQRAALERLDDAFEANTVFAYAIFDASSGDYVGSTGFHLRAGPETREIGYWLASTHTGRGLMTRVVEKLTVFAFTDFAVQRVEIRCDEANAASAAVAKRAGFELEEIIDREPAATADSGRGMIWARLR